MTEGDSLRVTLEFVYHTYPSPQSPVICWVVNKHAFAFHVHYLHFLPGHSGNNILYPKITVITAGMQAMFIVGFSWVDDGRGRLTTWSLYTLQIHYSLVRIDSPRHWHMFPSICCVLYTEIMLPVSLSVANLLNSVFSFCGVKAYFFALSQGMYSTENHTKPFSG